MASRPIGRKYCHNIVYIQPRLPSKLAFMTLAAQLFFEQLQKKVKTDLVVELKVDARLFSTC